MFANILRVVGLLMNLVFLVWALWNVERMAKAVRVPLPRPQLVPFDANGPIVGRPTRAQWRLRRRALVEAESVVLELESQYVDLAARSALRFAQWQLRELISKYDAQSPEYSGVAEPEVSKAA